MKHYLFLRPLILCGLLWCILVATVLLTRPPLSTIETRVLTVAWEMHVRGDYMVPSLNFAPYTQKPPLLAWLVNLGWLVMGYHSVVAVILVSLLSFGCIVWVFTLASRLWPDDTPRLRRATWLCFGAVMFQLYGTIIFYDFMLTFFVLMAAYGVWQAAQTGQSRYWILVCIGTGLGLLSKGPAMLVQIVPLAVLAPLWAPAYPGRWSHWYAKLILATGGAGVIVLAWAIPAAAAGGSVYGHWILLGQTTGRIFKAFDHAQPLWFYLAVAPALLMPWFVLPSLWRSLPLLKRWQHLDSPARFLLCWIVPVIVLFSLISGKQLHYILPLWAPFALVLTYLLPATFKRVDYTAGFAPFIIFAATWCGIILLHQTALRMDLPPMWQDILFPYPGLPFGYLLCLIGLLLFVIKRNALIPSLAIGVWLTLVIIHITMAPIAFDRFSADAISRAVTGVRNQEPDRPLAVVSARYQGDITFLARLTQAVEIIPLQHDQALQDFFARHPDGLALEQVFKLDELKPYHVLFVTPSRKRRFYALIEKPQDNAP